MLIQRNSLWDTVQARTALETPQIIVRAVPAESEIFSLVGVGSSMFKYGGRTLDRIKLPLEAPINGVAEVLSRSRFYSSPVDFLPKTFAFSENLQGDETYAGLVWGHYLYRAGVGSLEDSVPFALLGQIGFSALKSIAPISPSGGVADFSFTKLAVVAVDERQKSQVLLLDNTARTVPLALDLSAVLSAGEEVIYVQYMSASAGTIVAIVGTSRARIFLINISNEHRSVVKVASGDITTTMAPATIQATRITWCPVGAQNALGDFIVWSEQGFAYRLRFNNATPTTKTDIITTWDLRALMPIQNVALGGGNLLYSFLPDGTMITTPSGNLTPTSVSILYSNPTPCASPQDSVFLPDLTSSPYQVIYSVPSDDGFDGTIPVLLGISGTSQEPYELNLQDGYFDGDLAAQQGWVAAVGDPQVQEDPARFSFTGRVLHLVQNDHISHSISPYFGSTIILRVRVPSNNPTSGVGEGLIVRLSNGADSVQFYLNKTSIGTAATVKSSNPRTVDGYLYLDFKASIRQDRVYLTDLKTPGSHEASIALDVTGTAPSNPNKIEFIVDDQSLSVYDIEYFSVGAAANDALIWNRYIDPLNAELPVIYAHAGREYSERPDLSNFRDQLLNFTGEISRSDDKALQVNVSDKYGQTAPNVRLRDHGYSDLDRELILRNIVIHIGGLTRFSRTFALLFDRLVDYRDSLLGGDSWMRSRLDSLRDLSLIHNFKMFGASLGGSDHLDYSNVLSRICAIHYAPRFEAIQLLLEPLGFAAEPLPFSEFVKGRDHLDSGIPFDQFFFDTGTRQVDAVLTLRIHHSNSTDLDDSARVLPADPRARRLLSAIRTVVPYMEKVELGEKLTSVYATDFENLVGESNLVGQDGWTVLGTSPTVKQDTSYKLAYRGTKSLLLAPSAGSVGARKSFGALTGTVYLTGFRFLVRSPDRTTSSNGLKFRVLGTNDGAVSLTELLEVGVSRSSLLLPNGQTIDYSLLPEYLDENRWHHLGLRLDLLGGVVDMWVDNMLLIRAAPLAIESLSIDAIDIEADGETVDKFYVDELRVSEALAADE